MNEHEFLSTNHFQLKPESLLKLVDVILNASELHNDEFGTHNNTVI